jgi:hypothetical protein
MLLSNKKKRGREMREYGAGRSESFIFYDSYRKIIAELPEQDRLAMLSAVIGYGLDGIEPENFSGYLKAIFLSMKTNIDFSNQRYRACVENGKKGAGFGKLGGRPSKNPEKPLKELCEKTPKENPQKPLKEFSEKAQKGICEKPLSYSSSSSSSLSLSLSPSLTSSYSYSSSYADDVAAIKKGQLPASAARKDGGGLDWVERIFKRFKDLVQEESGHKYIGNPNDEATISKMVAEKGGEQVSARQSLFYVACCNEKNHLQNFNVENFAYNWAYIDEKMNVKSKPIGDKPTIIYDVRDAARDAEAAAAAAQASDTDETNDDDIEDVEREIEGDNDDDNNMQ